MFVGHASHYAFYSANSEYHFNPNSPNILTLTHEYHPIVFDKALLVILFGLTTAFIIKINRIKPNNPLYCSKYLDNSPS